MSITLENLIAGTRVQLSDSSCSQSKFWDNDDLILYINNALVTCWSLLTDDILQNYDAVAETNLVSGTSDYALPTDYYLEKTVLCDGIPCRKVRFSDQPIWENNTFVQPLFSQPTYTINSGNIIILPEPIHDSALGLRFYYLKVPPVLANLTDTVLIDDVYAQILEKLAGARAIQIKESIAEGSVLLKSAMEDIKLITGAETKEEKE